MKLSSLKDLKVIKKDLAPAEPEKSPVQRPRSKTVILKSKEEEHARNEGLVKGQKVRMMDTNDTATIVGFGKDYYELELESGNILTLAQSWNWTAWSSAPSGASSSRSTRSRTGSCAPPSNPGDRRMPRSPWRRKTRLRT